MILYYFTLRCPVRWKVRIKKITRGTVQKDKLVFNYPCILTIDGVHNHDLVKTSITYEYETKKKKGVDTWADIFNKRDSNIHIRLDIHNEDEVLVLLKRIQLLAKVKFVVKPAFFDKTCYKWSKRYVCHHGGRSKRKNLG